MKQIAQGLGQNMRLHRTDVHAPFEACRECKVRGSQLCQSIQNEHLFGAPPPVIRHFAPGMQFVERGKTRNFLGVIRRGFARRSVIKLSGKRIIVGLGMPGDIVGGLLEQKHDYEFEAATDIEVCFFDSATVMRQLEVNQPFLKLMLQEIDHQHHCLLGYLWRNGALTSRERIIAFLVWAVEFMPTQLLPDGSAVLSMDINRADWADLTNTAVETISRTLRYLQEKNLVTSLTPYRFHIRDLDLLATIAGVEPPHVAWECLTELKRMENRFDALKSYDRMTAVNAQVSGARRLNRVIKSMSVQKRGLAGRRPEDVQKEVRD